MKCLMIMSDVVIAFEELIMFLSILEVDVLFMGHMNHELIPCTIT